MRSKSANCRSSILSDESGKEESCKSADAEDDLSVIEEIQKIAEDKKVQELKKRTASAEPSSLTMIDTTGKNGDGNKLAVTFKSARRADMIVSTAQTRQSTSPPEQGRDSNLSR